MLALDIQYYVVNVVVYRVSIRIRQLVLQFLDFSMFYIFVCSMVSLNIPFYTK